MDRTIPTDAELPEGPGSVKPEAARPVIIDAADKPERHLEDCGPRDLEDIPVEQRVLQPPARDTMPAGHPSIREFERGIISQLAITEEKKRERLLEEARKPAGKRLHEELIAERNRMATRGQEKVNVASEDKASTEANNETSGPTVNAGGDSGDVPVETRPANPKRRGSTSKSSRRRS